MHTEKRPENISRRTLIKLMAAASPAICDPVAFFSASASIAGRSSVGQHEPHPRLFYNAASIERIRRVLADDAVVDAALRQHAEELLAAKLVPESVAEIGGGQHANYGTPANQMTEMGLTLGLVYHLTGDKRYAEKLRQSMLYYANYVRWAGQGLADRIPPWHSELNTSTFSFGYSTGYDALRGYLSESDRKTISEAMVRLAVLPILNDWVLCGMRIHSLDSMGHNWWGVCVAGAGLCALALVGDDPRAQEWINAIDAGFIQWFNYPGNVIQNRVATFERSGPSYESVGYTSYGVSEFLYYQLAWQNTYPARRAARIERLEHLATYYLQMLYPTSSGHYSVNFNDSSVEEDVTEPLLLLAACSYINADAARYLSLVHTHPQSTMLALLRQFSPSIASGIAPTSSIYPEMGWATMRSSWQNDAAFLAMKSGYTWNHAHADAGTFILFKEGKPLIIDSGTCLYSRPEYRTYYCSSRAHNVILFNGQGEPEEDIDLGCKFPGHLHSLIDGAGLKYVYADATGPMARWFVRNYRHWIWIGDLILIVDDVRAHAPGEMDWLLHYEGEYTGDPQTGIHVKNGPAAAVIRMLFPLSKLHQEMGFADHDPDKKIPYLVFHPDGKEQIRQFITAICLNPAIAPEFSVQDDPNYLKVQISVPGVVEELYLSRRTIATPGTTCINTGEFTTDAYMFLIRRVAGAQPERYFVAEGSYLRQGAKSLMESLSKRFICWSLQESLRCFSDQGPFSIQIGAKQRPRSVSWNGKVIPHSYDPHSKLVTVTSGT